MLSKQFLIWWKKLTCKHEWNPCGFRALDGSGASDYCHKCHRFKPRHWTTPKE